MNRLKKQLLYLGLGEFAALCTFIYVYRLSNHGSASFMAFSFLIVFGIFYLVYSIKYRHKPTLYFKDIKVVKGKEAKYLKLQLYFSILNSLIFIVIGAIVAKNHLDSIYVVVTPLILHFINFIVLVISRIKGYVEP